MTSDGPRDANIAKKPQEIPLDQWVVFVDYRARPDTKAKEEQNIRNRSHLTTPHTLGSKTIARLRNEMETQLGRPVTRAELFQASHTTSTGSFVNEEARQNYENLVIRSQSSSENEAFTSIFGKEHPGYARGMGLGVVPTQIYGSSSRSGSRPVGGGGTEADYDTLKNMVQRLTQQVEQNQDEINQLKQQVASQNQNTTPVQENVGSPAIGRRSSQDSHSARNEEN